MNLSLPGRQLLATLIVGLLLFAPTNLFAVCGDADGSGGISVGDAVFLIDYVLKGGPAPANYDDCELDGNRGITVYEPSMIIGCIFGGCFFDFTGCESIGPPYIPQPDSSCRLYYHWPVPANLDHFTVHFYLESEYSVRAIQLPLTFLVDGVPARIDSTEYLDASPYFNGTTISDDSTTMITGSVPLVFEPIEEHFLKVFLSIPFSTQQRELDVQYTSFIPPQAPPEHQYEIAPMAVTFNTGRVQPVLTKICCQTAGDADQNGSLSIGDAVFIINYIFGGGPIPGGECISEVDADASGGVSIGDAVYLINYIFGGGPAPTCFP
jgi:hypothetical protein